MHLEDLYKFNIRTLVLHLSFLTKRFYTFNLFVFFFSVKISIKEYATIDTIMAYRKRFRIHVDHIFHSLNYSSRAPCLTSGLQGSVNVQRGALLLVP